MLTKWVWKSHLPLVILEVSKCADLIIRFNLSSMNTKRLYYSHKLPILKKIVSQLLVLQNIHMVRLPCVFLHNVTKACYLTEGGTVGILGFVF